MFERVCLRVIDCDQQTVTRLSFDEKKKVKSWRVGLSCNGRDCRCCFWTQVTELQAETAAAGGHMSVVIGLDGICWRCSRCGPAADLLPSRLRLLESAWSNQMEGTEAVVAY